MVKGSTEGQHDSRRDAGGSTEFASIGKVVTWLRSRPLSKCLWVDLHSVKQGGLSANENSAYLGAVGFGGQGR